MNYFILPGIERVIVNKLTEEAREYLFKTNFKAVCKVYGECPDEVYSNNSKRKREFVEIRQICMTIYNCKYNYSLYVSADYFNKKHTTAMYAIKAVRNLRETNKEFRKKTDVLLSGINLKDKIQHG